jgi:hypothetical protein
MRSLLVGVGLLVACNASRSSLLVLAGSGTPDAGFAETADGGAAAAWDGIIDCSPFGAAKLNWGLAGHQDPGNTNYGDSYIPIATDSLDGIVVTHAIQQGHFGENSDATYGPDGRLRVPSWAVWSCWQPGDPCSYSSAVISNGTIYESEGIVRSARDGHIVYQFDPAAGAPAPAGRFDVQKGVAANGGIAVFTWSNDRTQTSTATAVDVDGGTIWQHTFSKPIEAAAVDDTGVALLRMSYAGDLVAFAPDGRKLYSVSPDGGFYALRDLRTAGGRYSLGGRMLYRVADGAELISLPAAPSEPPLLTASRAYLWEDDKAAKRSKVSAIDLGTGNTLWERTLRQTYFAAYAFSVTAERAVIIDPQDVLHVIRSDSGTDVLACKIAPDVTTPVLLSGGRLAVRHFTNLDVYDLPY